MKTNRLAVDYTVRIIAVSLLTLLLLSVLARGHAQTASQAASPAGIYTLVSVDGKNVPCTINHDGRKMDVQSGAFTISTNGQVTSVMTVSVGDRKDIRIERTATYTAKNAELTMKWQNAGITKGAVAGQTFTMTNEGMAYVYRK
jgi:hypothetical protein